MVARYFFELLILYLFLNIIHVEKITEFYLPVRGLIDICCFVVCCCLFVVVVLRITPIQHIVKF